MLHQLAASTTTNQNPLVPNWTEVIVGAIGFFIVFFALWKVLLPRITKTLEERTDAIEGGLQRAEEAQQEANRMVADYVVQPARTVRTRAVVARARTTRSYYALGGSV